MKITIWIRPSKDGRTHGGTIRTDTKYESFDTPLVQNYGKRIVEAIESCTKFEKEEKEK